MPLTWDATKVEAWDAIDPALKTSVDFMLMSVGIGEITEDNVEKFYRRVNIMEKATGAFRFQTDENSVTSPLYLSPDEARSLIGYRANISPMTDAKFRAHLFNIHERFTTF